MGASSHRGARRLCGSWLLLDGCHRVVYLWLCGLSGLAPVPFLVLFYGVVAGNACACIYGVFCTAYIR